LEFHWASRHTTINLRLLRAGGDDVKIITDQNVRADPPEAVRNDQTLHIDPSFVAYAADQHWLLRVLVDDVTGTTLTKFSVKAIYDDTAAPNKSEALVEDEDVKPNEASDYEKTLTIPERI
jgi:hypothetical protein